MNKNTQSTDNENDIQVTVIEKVSNYITEDQVDQVFRYLESVAVRLQKDPTVLGPSYVHEKLMECRDFSIEIETLLVRFYDVERRIKNELAGLTEVHKAERSELMALDNWVSKGKSNSDREARADVKLKSLVNALKELREQLVNAQYIIKTIELKKDGLNRVNYDIKKQVSLMEFSKQTNVPLDEDDYDDVIDNSKSKSKKKASFGEDDDVDMLGLFSDEQLPKVQPSPKNIPESVIAHIDINPEDPTQTLMEDDEDPMDFLNNIVLESPKEFKKESLDIDDDINEDDMADLFSGTDFEPINTKIHISKNGKSVNRDSVVDMDLFLSEI